jgi:hypothetical protein
MKRARRPHTDHPRPFPLQAGMVLSPSVSLLDHTPQSRDAWFLSVAPMLDWFVSFPQSIAYELACAARVQ